MLVTIYKGSKREEMYLYVPFGDELKELPEALLGQFGELEVVMSLKLDRDRRLARVAAVDVLAAIEEQGFFLQMPPTPAELLARERAND